MRFSSALGTLVVCSAASLPACVKHTTLAPNFNPAAQPEQSVDLTPIPPFAIAVPEDAIVRVVAPGTTCTGTLIEEDLVLTAHHCVVERGSRGDFTKKEHAPANMSIELGGDYLPWGTIGVKAIVAPPCGETGGEGDIAILVLDRKLVGVAPMTPRLDAPPRTGEIVDPAGFGRCALSGDGIHRSIRTGGPVLAVAPGTMYMNAAICPGDSGGPVFARGTRQVVGVVSESAMDHDERTAGPSIMVRLDTWRGRKLFSNAQEIAKGESKAGLPPITCE